MTREEQIEREALLDYDAYADNNYHAFKRGVAWADENQPGMAKMRKDYELLFLLKKQELIKKACEWLEDTDFDMEYWNSEEGFCKSEFINDFCKAMEE
jgi:hypothetical protein